MTLKVEDKVRSANGTEGYIAAMDDESALIVIHYSGPGTRLISLPLAELTPIAEYGGLIDDPPG